MPADTITLLRSFATSGTRMAKTLQEDGEWSGYGTARHFQPISVPLENLNDLHEQLDAMQGDPHLCAIRGTMRDINRVEHGELFHPSKADYVKRALRVFRDQPHHWVMLDIDHYQSEADPCTDPEAAVGEAIEALLPEEFHYADCVWQLSNSAGYKPGLKAHLWFWLDRPWSSAMLKQWATEIAPGVDRAPLNPVQVHYTAAPVIEDGSEPPLVQRMGFREGMLDSAVRLHMPESTLTRGEMVDHDYDGTVAPPDPREKDNYIGAFCSAWSIADVVHEFLPDVFEFQDGSDRRLNFLLAESGAGGGAFITDDGLHIVNKHNSDPFYNRATNAFDIVRYFYFNGEADREDKALTQRASYREMMAFCAEDEATVESGSQVPGLTRALNAEDDFDAEDAPDNVHREVEQLIEDYQSRFMAAVEKSETHSNSSAHDLWRREKLPEDAGQAFSRNKDGAIVKSNRNTQLVFAIDPWLRRAIGYDEFGMRRGVYGELPWRGRGISVENPSRFSDDDYSQLMYYIEEEYGFRPGEDMVKNALSVASRWAVFHPVRHWLSNLQWDGVPRLDDFLVRYAGAEDSLYTRAVTARTMIGAVKRIMHPGCQHDSILVLEGEQGLRKSSLVKILAGGDQWYREGLPDMADEKKMLESLRSTWLVELPELSAIYKMSNDEAKEVITRRRDRAREAYAREETSLERQSIFIGTTNNTNYLRDATGNRRYWPLEIKYLQLDAIEAIRDQLMAEAMHRMQAGERTWIDNAEPELQAEAEAVRNERYDESPDEAIIHEWLETPVDEFDAEGDAVDFSLDANNYRIAVTRNEVMIRALGVNPETAHPSRVRSAQMAVDRAMKQSENWNGRPERRRINGVRGRYFFRKATSGESRKDLH